MKLLSPMSAFIIASAGIHVGLVMSSYSTNITLPGSTGSVMTVELKIEEKLSKQPSTNNNYKVKQVKLVKNKTSQKNKSLVTTRTFSNNANDSSFLPSNIKESTQAINKEKDAESKAQVISIIYKALNQHFTYPRLAQRRNWQGKVLLSIRVTATGKIKNIKLNQSSGYSILDKAAISSLTKVGELPQLISWLPYDIDLTLPVIYQLTEG